jgi:hypothetical protein
MTPLYLYFLYKSSLNFCMCYFFAGNDTRIFLHVVEESKLSAACYRMRSIKPYMSLNTLKIVYSSYFNSTVNYDLPFLGNKPHSIKIFRMQDYQLFSFSSSPLFFVSCYFLFSPSFTTQTLRLPPPFTSV